MNEIRKSSLRRASDPAFMQHYFAGDGLDIGLDGDDLADYTSMFPRMGRVTTWKSTQGDASRMDGLRDASFDFVHSSHLIAEQDNPHKTLARWLDLVKPGGHVIVTMPDQDLYGGGVWPSRFNRRHRSSFTLAGDGTRLPRSVNVLELVQAVSAVADCERIKLVREHYDPNRTGQDQTANSAAECAIEIVLRKRDVPTAQDMLNAATQARTAEQGIAACKEAARTYPYRIDSYHRGMLELLRWKAPEEVDALWDECVRRLPGEHLPRLYQSLHVISRGKLREGFALREKMMAPFGWQRRTTVEPPGDIARWTGQPLAGKSIAIWSEFGLGDEIFFLRYAKILRDECGAAKVVVVCQAPLVELYEASGTADQVVCVDDAAAISGPDYWVYPHAIPAYLHHDLDTLPDTVPYLRAPEIAQSRMPAVARDRIKVGIVFKGNPSHENDKQRSLPALSVLDDVLNLDGFEFFSLQKGAGADEAAHHARARDNFHDVGAQLQTMAETARAIESLDVVITVDTSVAHVAGAMGKPVWLMLPFYGDWRWHYVREDSPWYPQMRLFRRKSGCDWSEVVARIVGRLKEMRLG